MKQLTFVFAATATVAAIAGSAIAATRITNRHDAYAAYTGCDYAGCEEPPAPVYIAPPAPMPAPVPVVQYQAPPPPVIAPAPAPVVVKQPSAPRQPNSLTLPDPFFQPCSGNFLSLTDIGYATNTYNFEVEQCSGPWCGLSGKWDAREIFVKEDVMVGITDNLSINGMIKYSNAKYKMHWNEFTDPYGTYFPPTTDTMTDSGINTWGLGLQYLIFEDDQWVANANASYQNTRDVSDAITLGGKLGYKTSPSTTFYGLANLAYIMWDQPVYGNAVVDNYGQVAFIAFNADGTNNISGNSSSLYAEFGGGVFTKLSDEWSVNLEAKYGYYEWHSQIAGYASLFWQPTDWIALGIYGATSIWDSANGANKIYLYSWCNGTDSQCYIDAINAGVAEPLAPNCEGRVALSKYNEMQFGAKLILYF